MRTVIATRISPACVPQSSISTHVQLPQPVQARVVLAARSRPAVCPISGMNGKEPLKHGWTPDEDALILSAVQKEGQKWSFIAARLPGRTDDAVRNRYLRLQRKRKAGDSGQVDEAELKKGDMWTAQEDALVMQAANQFGLKWQQIAESVPGRSANAVRNRYLRCCGSPGDAASLPSV